MRTKFVHDIATVISDQYAIYLCRYIAVDLIPDLHTISIAYRCTEEGFNE